MLAPPGTLGAASAWVDLERFTFPGPWGPFPFVPREVGNFATISAAWTGEGRHFVGTTTNGQLWHQLRGLNAAFAVFGDVEVEGVGQDVGSFTAADCG